MRPVGLREAFPPLRSRGASRATRRATIAGRDIVLHRRCLDAAPTSPARHALARAARHRRAAAACRCGVPRDLRTLSRMRPVRSTPMCRIGGCSCCARERSPWPSSSGRPRSASTKRTCARLGSACSRASWSASASVPSRSSCCITSFHKCDSGADCSPLRCWSDSSSSRLPLAVPASRRRRCVQASRTGPRCRFARRADHESHAPPR